MLHRSEKEQTGKDSFAIVIIDRKENREVIEYNVVEQDGVSGWKRANAKVETLNKMLDKIHAKQEELWQIKKLLDSARSDAFCQPHRVRDHLTLAAVGIERAVRIMETQLFGRDPRNQTITMEE